MAQGSALKKHDENNNIFYELMINELFHHRSALEEVSFL